MEPLPLPLRRVPTLERGKAQGAKPGQACQCGNAAVRDSLKTQGYGGEGGGGGEAPAQASKRTGGGGASFLLATGWMRLDEGEEDCRRLLGALLLPFCRRRQC